MTKKIEPVLGANPKAEIEIDTGHHSDDTRNGFRLWCAREALRQGELRISGQMGSVSLMVSRAMTALGWSVTLSLALTTASSIFPAKSGVAVPITFLLLAAVLFLFVILPRGWGVPGDDPSWIMSRPYLSELEMVEALAKRASRDCETNAVKLVRLSWSLRLGCLLMVLAVCAALAEVAGLVAPALGLVASLVG